MRLRTVLTGALVGTLALLTMAVPANADNGDGLAACNRGEICFQLGWDNFTTSNFQRHFWWSDYDHSNDLLVDTSIHAAFPLADGARGYWNRDTACYVGLYDLDSNGGMLLYYLNAPGSAAADAAANRNNAHVRCPIF